MKVFLKQMLMVFIATTVLGGHASAHDSAKKSTNRKISTEEHAFGREGDPQQATRTVQVAMGDNMRFSPAQLVVKRGDTVRFVVKNAGKVMHEMVLGTMQELKAHADMMKKHPGMEHDEPYMAHVKPGATQQMVWHFTKPGEFYYGCLIPGHFEAGMVGKIIVK